MSGRRHQGTRKPPTDPSTEDRGGPALDRHPRPTAARSPPPSPRGVGVPDVLRAAASVASWSGPGVSFSIADPGHQDTSASTRPRAGPLLPHLPSGHDPPCCTGRGWGQIKRANSRVGADSPAREGATAGRRCVLPCPSSSRSTCGGPRSSCGRGGGRSRCPPRWGVSPHPHAPELPLFSPLQRLVRPERPHSRALPGR